MTIQQYEVSINHQPIGVHHTCIWIVFERIYSLCHSPGHVDIIRVQPGNDIPTGKAKPFINRLRLTLVWL